MRHRARCSGLVSFERIAEAAQETAHADHGKPGEGGFGRQAAAELNPGDVAYIPQGFGHAIRNTGTEDLEMVQTWDNPLFEEIDLDKWIASSPRYLLQNNFAGVSPEDISKLKQG